MSEASAVSFGTVSVREFDRVPGDHPDCALGVPLSIGWAYCEQRPVPVCTFEDLKAETREDGEDGTFVTKLGCQERMRLLQDFKVPLDEILAAEADATKFKKEKAQRKSEEEATKGDVNVNVAAPPSKKPLKQMRKRMMSIFKLNKQQAATTKDPAACAA